MYTEKKNMKYDFSWIEKEIRQWYPDILRDIDHSSVKYRKILSYMFFEVHRTC